MSLEYRAPVATSRTKLYATNWGWAQNSKFSFASSMATGRVHPAGWLTQIPHDYRNRNGTVGHDGPVVASYAAPYTI